MTHVAPGSFTFVNDLRSVGMPLHSGAPSEVVTLKAQVEAHLRERGIREALVTVLQAKLAAANDQIAALRAAAAPPRIESTPFPSRALSSRRQQIGVRLP